MLDGYKLTSMEGHDRPQANMMLRKGLTYSWTDEQISVHYVMRKEAPKVKNLEKIKPSHMASILAAIVRKNTPYLDSMEALVN